MKMSELVSKTIEDAEVALAIKNEGLQMAVSVKTFGAKGDGVADDTEAIQSVIDSLENGGVIFFPEGNYLVSSSLIINKSNVTLKGLDKNLVQIKDHPSMTTPVPILLITGTNKTNRIENITVEGIKVRNGSAVTGDYTSDKDGIRVIFVNNITVKHCIITEIEGEAGIVFRYCRNINVLDNYIYRCTYAACDLLEECEDIRILDNEIDTLTSTETPNTYAIATGYDGEYGVADFPIKNLWIERNVVRNNPRWEGIDSHGGQNIWIKDNYVENCKTGIMVSSAESGNFVDITTKNVFIENNVLIRGNGETGLHGLYAGGNQEMFIENLIVSGNEVKGFGYNDKGCLVVEFSINAEVTQNTIDDYRYNGIGITGWNNDIKIHDNLIKNKDVSVIAPGVGINAIYVYQDGNVGVSVENNKSYPDSDEQAPTNVVHAYSVSNVTAFGNKFKGASTLYEGKVLSGFTTHNLDNVGLYYLRKGDIIYDTNEKPMYRVTGPETGHAGNRPLLSEIFSGTVGTNILTVDTLNFGIANSYGLGCNITVPLSGGGTFKAIVKSWTDFSILLDRNLPENIVNQSVTIDVATVETLEEFTVNVKKFGAIGDGVTDDSTSVEQAIAYAAQKQATGKKVKLLFPGNSQEYKTTKTITIPPNIDVEMLAPIVYKGSADEPCLVIGETDESTTGVYRLAVDRETRSDWNSENCIGIVLINADTSDIHIELARNFTIGVQCLGSDGGWAYNTTKLGAINNNKIGLDLTSELDGWANENLFLGGRFSVDSVVHIDKDRIGVRIWGKDGTYDFYNNNVFEKPSFEVGSNPGLGVALPILIEHGYSNKFNSIRAEGPYPYTVITRNGSRANYVEVGYGVVKILNEGNRGNNYCYEYGQENLAVTYAFENLHKKANQYDATQTYVPGVAFSSGTEFKSMISSVIIQSDCLQFTSSRFLNVVVDTTSRKHFIIHKDALPGFGGRIYIRCYDVNGNILTETKNGESAWEYAKGSSTLYFYTSSNAYETGSDSVEPLELNVSEEVKKIAVMFTRGTNDLKIRGFSITSIDGATNVYNPAPDKANGQGVATQIPTLGTYEVGRFLANDNPVVQSDGSIIEGWTCITGGTPGVWVERKNYPTNYAKIEARTSDPASPVVGQMWLRSDL